MRRSIVLSLLWCSICAAAIDSSTVWEVRTTGSQTNGAGFADLDPGTSADYSQQAAAQLSLSDIATDGAGTGVSSATGGFTGAMVGNVIYLTGGSPAVTAGWYQITGYTSGNAVTIDRSAGASKAGATGNVGGAFAYGGALDDDFMETLAQGNTVYIKSGTYSLGEIASKNGSGTATLPISFTGYDTDRNVRPTGTNRPLIDCGASYYWGSAGSYYRVQNLRFTGSSSSVAYLTSTSYSVILNCWAENTSGSAGRNAFWLATSTIVVGCEAVSTNGYAFQGGECYACYARDSQDGFRGSAGVNGCIADTCSRYGIYSAGSVFQSTVYKCGTGVYFSSSTLDAAVLNTIISTCTTGVDGANETDAPMVAYCTLYDNGTDFGANLDECLRIANRSGNPGLNDPDNDDFRIDTDDDVYQQGVDAQVYTGATVR